MVRWLAPLVGVVGLVALVVGMLQAELDRASLAGVGVVGYGVLLLAVAGGLVAAVEELDRRRNASPRR